MHLLFVCVSSVKRDSLNLGFPCRLCCLSACCNILAIAGQNMMKFSHNKCPRPPKPDNLLCKGGWAQYHRFHSCKVQLITKSYPSLVNNSNKNNSIYPFAFKFLYELCDQAQATYSIDISLISFDMSTFVILLPLFAL